MRMKAVLLAALIMADLCLLAAGLSIFKNSGDAVLENSAGVQCSDTAKDAGEKFLALTFDDGPHAVYTKKLLDGLRERSVRASFFLVGENIAGNEDLVRQMMEDGHLIGTHCYSHVDLTRKSMEKACMDIVKTNDMIERITGTRPVYIRPPYGNWSEELEECVGMTPVFWGVDTLDWKSQNSQKILQHISKDAGKHQIILMHDVFGPSVDAALAAIDTLTGQGYTFVTVDELLID